MVWGDGAPVPAMIAKTGADGIQRFLEFFTATIRNPNTREAYARAVGQFLVWCERRGIDDLRQITPMIVAAHVEKHPGSPPTVKQHLAAIKGLFDWLVVGQVIPFNPASSVRGPSYSTKKGKTPVLTAEQCRRLLDSIDTSTIAGLRDRALIGVMVFSFARVSAVVHMKVKDFLNTGTRWTFRLHEKGGKFHEVPAHHNAALYVHEYIEAAGIAEAKPAPLFRAISRERMLTERPMTRGDALRMVKRRACVVGLPPEICCHTFRATGITAYLENGGDLETAAQIANHESPRTTKLYDRTGDVVDLDEVERIAI